MSAFPVPGCPTRGLHHPQYPYRPADGFLDVDDVDEVAAAVDVRPHFRVPAAGAVSEVDARLDGELREAQVDRVAHGAQHGVRVLLYEAGEGLRFDEVSARTGVMGILRVMRRLGMVKAKGIAKPQAAPMRSSSSFWLRAPAGGLLRTVKTIGAHVDRGDILGLVSNPFGDVETEIVANEPGLLVGRTNLPVVNEGDGLFCY